LNISNICNFYETIRTIYLGLHHCKVPRSKFIQSTASSFDQVDSILRPT